MSEKIDIDGVRFKVEADLSKLEADLKKGEGSAKKGGENLGKAAGQGFSTKLKGDANDALKSIEGSASSSSGKIAGAFGKIGAAAVAAFSISKVVDFFSSSIKYAEDMEKKMEAAGKSSGGVAKSIEKIEAQMEASSNKIKGIIGPVLLQFKKLAVDALASVVDFFTQLITTTRESLASLGEAARKDVNEFNKLGQNLKDLKVGTQEFIETRETLIKQSDKLGIKIEGEINTTEKLVAVYKKLQFVKQQSLEATINEQQAAQSTLRNRYFVLTGRQYKDERGLSVEDKLRQRGKEFEMGYRPKSLTPEQRFEERDIREQLQELEPSLKDAKIAKFKLEKGIVDPEKKDAAGGGGGGQSIQEARFIDSRLRLITIARNLEATEQKAASEYKSNKIDKPEYERRLAFAKEEARQANEFEVNNLRQVYAAYIEDKTTAALIGLKTETDNARRVANEQFEAELKLAEMKGTAEKELQQLKEDNIKRSEEINKNAIRKEATIRAQSYADTLSAANATTTGLGQIANAKDAAGGLGGAGATLGGLSKLSPALGALGPVGTALGAVGGIVGTLSGLFGKSDEERAREAADQKRRDDVAREIMELQASYQRQQLELAQAQAKLPFENLTRQLRLVDIEAGKQRLAGVDEATVNKNRLAARSSAIQGVLSSQAGAIAGGQMFAGQGSSADQLTSFLSERAAQSVAVAQFMAIVQAMTAPGASLGALAELNRQAKTLSGRIPPELYNSIAPFSSAIDNLVSAMGTGDQVAIANAQFGVIQSLGGTFNRANSIASEIGSDTGIAENLLSVIEQDQQTQLEIAQHTKKTSENTTKLVDTPQRQSSIIDISRGYTRSLGQILNPGITNTALPASVKAAVLATDIQKSIQERSLDKLQNIEIIQRDSRELLAIIAKGVNNSSNSSGSLLAELESLYRRSIAA